MTSPKPFFESKATGDGKVQISLFKKNGKPISIAIPAEIIPLLACKMLQDARSADDALNDTSLAGMPALSPSKIGLTDGKDDPFPTALVVHMGKARFGIAISNPRELGRALMTVSAESKASN